MKIIATIRNIEGEKIDLLFEGKKNGILQEFALVLLNGSGLTKITLSHTEFLDLLRAGLEYFKVQHEMIDAVMPALSKANIVR